MNSRHLFSKSFNLVKHSNYNFTKKNQLLFNTNLIYRCLSTEMSSKSSLEQTNKQESLG
jgi:hypothetical protein